MSASRRGLTLIEIALAVSILAIMGTLTWGTIGRSFDAYEVVTANDQRYHNVRIAMDRMTRELSMAFLTPQKPGLDEDRMHKTIFKAERGSPFYRIDFTSFAHQILRADAKESDQCEIGYFGAVDPDDKDKLNLMRREDPRLDGEPEEGGEDNAYVLAEDIKDFTMRFYDPRDDDWVDEWDTEDEEFRGRLPTLVELTMTIVDDMGREEKFVTKTEIFLPRMLQ